MISWRDEAGGLHHGSLFGTFAALARGEAWSFPALRPHQREPWHAFTVQVAALALIRAGIGTPPHDEAAWWELLLALSDGVAEAWELVVDDWTKPALLQPPVVVPANIADYKNTLHTPDALDMLVTAKNHDVKQERMASASEQDWLFALVTLQTTEGFLGAGNYGVSRMNGGFATRMSLGIRPSGGGAAAVFARDVRRLVADARAKPERRAGLSLLWAESWDGTRSLDYTRLDELYVEVCRRVRLQRYHNSLQARVAGSKCARVAAAELKGRTEDPWAPLKADGSSSHTPTGAGFGYRQFARLLNPEDITLPLLARLHPDDDREGLTLTATALVRGQGKTEGLHRRPVRTSRMEEIEAYTPDGVEVLDRVGDLAMRRTLEAGEAARVLARAISQFLQGGPEDRDVRRDDSSTKAKVEPWSRAFHMLVDDEIFEASFWSELAGKKGHRREWRAWLAATALEMFEQAFDDGPRSEMRRKQAWARARNYLDRRLSAWVKEIGDDDAG
jgi:CRISPR system Cascade subunit CasA